MITESDIQKPCSPRGLRQFVTQHKKKIQSDRTERHNAIQRKGLYNVFIKEIVPLSDHSGKILGFRQVIAVPSIPTEEKFGTPAITVTPPKRHT
jgi:hypothetical protein